MEELGLAADRGGADEGALREGAVGVVRGLDGAAEDKGVAGVFALEGAGQHDAVGEFGFEILEAVDSEVYAAGDLGLVDFLGEKALAADVGQTAVLHGVAGGLDGVFFEDVHAAQHGADAAQEIEEVACLHQGQWRAAGADAQRQRASVAPGAAGGRKGGGGIVVGEAGGIEQHGRNPWIGFLVLGGVDQGVTTPKRWPRSLKKIFTWAACLFLVMRLFM